MKRKRESARTMKFRRAASLAVTLQGDRLVVHNFLTRDSLLCSAGCLEFLAAADDWCGPEQLIKYLSEADGSIVVGDIPELIKANMLMVSDTRQAKLDEKYRRDWEWGVPAGFFHFSVRDTRFITGRSARTLMRKRKAWRPSPPLYQSNRRGQGTIKLPLTDLEQQPFAVMRARRSRRVFAEKPIPLGTLADCLFSGNGIVDFGGDKDFGKLPLSMTPSGGARNPFELYIYARNVTGLRPGFYHYGALRHDLGLVRRGEVDVPAMMATQRWPRKAAAIIFLVANFPRTMWKYHMPIAYRVVMVEAGFIGQNIALAATHHGLSAVPSGALGTSLVEKYLNLPPVESSVVLSLSIGKPKD